MAAGAKGFDRDEIEGRRVAARAGRDPRLDGKRAVQDVALKPAGRLDERGSEMEENLTMREIARWLGQMRVPPVSVGVMGESSLNLTVDGALEMTVAAAGNTLSVSGERALPDGSKAALASVRLEEVATSVARAAAVPMTASTLQSGATQRVVFTAPLFADGLTPNELASAVWCVWNAHDLLLRQIESYRQIEAISAEMQTLREQEAEPAESETPAPRDTAPEASAGGEAVDAPDAAVLFCPQCGNQVRPGARFCNKCGGAL